MSLSETAAADGRIVSVEPGRAASGAAVVADLEGRTIEELGSIGAGKAADLLIVDGDPLEEIKLLIAGIVAAPSYKEGA